jgi:hypothetical protein
MISRRVAISGGAVALLATGGAMAGRNEEFGFWQAMGRATGTRDDLGPIDFATLKRRDSPNDALLCSASLCPLARADGPSPVFDMPAEKLRATIRAIARAEPRTAEISITGDTLRFVQRSLVMRFPDVIDVATIQMDDGRSTLAIYSRSAVGRSDLGVNRSRVERWVAAAKG